MYLYYNQMEKKELQKIHLYFYIYLCRDTYQYSIYVGLSYCLVSFSFQPEGLFSILVGQVFYNRFSVFLFFCEFLNFPFIFEG